MISDEEFETLLRDALVDYVGETPDYPGELSPKYQRRFKRMLADPAGYVKRRQHRPWRWRLVRLLFVRRRCRSWKKMFCRRLRLVMFRRDTRLSTAKQMKQKLVKFGNMKMLAEIF